MLKLENSIRGLSFSRVAFDLTIQDKKHASVAQSVEQRTENPCVDSSILS